MAAKSSNEDLLISFHPTPDYAGIAKAAAGKQFGDLEGGLYTATVGTAEELDAALTEAIQEVSTGRGACIEVLLADESPVSQAKGKGNEMLAKDVKEEKEGTAG